MTTSTSVSTASESASATTCVHVVGAGPVGLLLTALLQTMDGFSVKLYEKRPDYTRTRMVQLEPYLVANSVDSYQADDIDGDSVSAIFEPAELLDGLAFRQAIPSDLMGLLQNWTQGFTPLNTIERSLSDLIDARTAYEVQRTMDAVTVEDLEAMVQPGDILIDCTGHRSLLRDRLIADGGDEDGANTLKIHLEYALVVTFLYSQNYDCNEYCKYYKNLENADYKFIPMVDRTIYDGSVSHVTGIVNITAEEYEAMPSRCDGDWLRANFPGVLQSMDRFIGRMQEETNGVVVGDFEFVRIPLDLYRARNATSRQWLTAPDEAHPLAGATVFLTGDSAIGSPYFQSISLGFECAMFLARLLQDRALPLEDKFDRYEHYIYRQWLRVYMRSKMIKHNKDLVERLDDPFALLEKLHIF